MRNHRDPTASKLIGAGVLLASLGVFLGACKLGASRSGGTKPAGTPSRPNIVLIMADDMGYSDIGCYGGEIETPNLDALAAGGLRFTQFYNTGRCCPTRASLLTGLYPHQAGVGHMMHNHGVDGYRGDLNNRCVTIAEVLRGAGYATYMTGKWHVTRFTKPKTDAEKHSWPLQRGFQRYYGTITGAGNYFNPSTLTLGNQSVQPEGANYYYTDALSSYAARFIDEHPQDKPFFMYVAYTAPHWPLHAPAETIAKYRGKYLKGWDTLRDERYRRMVATGLIQRRWQLTPRDARAWDDVKEAKKTEMDFRMAIYAAQIDRMDQGIGRIVNALRRRGLFDNTLILFLADNGGCAEGGEFGGGPANFLGTKQGSMLSYGRGWANASNTPFRRYKHWVHEGGIATPLIAHWPAGIKRRNEFERQPGHLIDIMATCVELAGAAYPTRRGQSDVQPMEGTSLAPAFGGGKLARGRPIFFEHEGNRAVRDGKWKLVARGATGPWELYDMEADRSEINNLAADYPEVAKRLNQKWEAWAARANAVPWPWAGKHRGENIKQKARKKRKPGAKRNKKAAPRK